MKPNQLKSNLRDGLIDSIIIGSNVMRWCVRTVNGELTRANVAPNSTQQPANITYFSTPEPPTPLYPEPVAAYKNQLNFHEGEVARGIDEKMRPYHLRKIEVLRLILGESVEEAA